MRHPILAMVVTCTFLNVAAAGTQPGNATLEKDRNAALAYAQVWLMLSDDDRRQIPRLRAITEEWKPDEVLVELLERNSDRIEGLLYASKLERCDWELRRELGIRLLLPHASYYRESVALLLSDAHRAAAGEPDVAASRLAAVLRVAGHMAEDRTLVTSGSAAEAAWIATREIGELLDEHEVSRDMLEEIRDALGWFDGADPLHYKAAIMNEVEVGMRRSAAELLDAKRQQFGGFEGITLTDEPREVHDADEQRRIDVALEKARAWAHSAVAAWDTPDGDEKLRLLHDAVRSGAYGELAKTAASSLDRSWREWRAVRGRLDALRDRLDDLLTE